MKNRKLFVLILLSLCVACIFAACGEINNGMNRADTETESVASASVMAAKSVSGVSPKISEGDFDYVLALSEYKIKDFNSAITVKSPLGEFVSVDSQGKFICLDVGRYIIAENGVTVKTVMSLSDPMPATFTLETEIADSVYTQDSLLIPKAEVFTELETFDSYSVEVLNGGTLVKSFDDVKTDLSFVPAKSGTYSVVYSVVDGFGCKLKHVKTVEVLSRRQIINISIPESNAILNAVSFKDVMGVYEGVYYPVEVMLTAPDGNSEVIESETYVIPKAGVYSVRFTSEIAGETVVELVDFTAVSSEASLFSHGKNIVSVTPCKDTKNKTGLEISADGVGSHVYYNQVIDLNEFNSDDKLINFFVKYDEKSNVRRMRVTLIDVNDERNYVSVYWQRSGSKGWEHLSYCLAEFNGYAIGISNEAGKNPGYPREIYGALLTSSTVSKTNPFNFTYSTSENAIYVWRTATTKIKIIDFDDTENLGSYKPWHGFSENRVYMKIDFIDSINAGIQITSIGGRDLTKSSVPTTDENYLRFTHDGKTINGTETIEIPAYVGYKCNLPVPITDNVLTGNIDVEFSLSKKNGGTYVEYDGNVSDYVFMPTEAGEYKATYAYTDVYGTYCVKTFEFTVLAGTPPKLNILYSNKTVDIMSHYRLPELKLSGGTGALTAEITYMYNGKVVVPDQYGEIFLSEKGYVEIFVRAEDSIGVTAQNYFYIFVNDNVCLIEQENAPLSFLAGWEYDLSDFVAYNYRFNEDEQGYIMAKTVTVNGELLDGFKFTPDGSTDVVTVALYGGFGTEFEVKKEFTVPVIPAIVNSKIVVSDFFFGDKDGVETELTGDGFAFGFDKDLSLTFANPVATDELSIEFALIEGKIDFNSVKFTLTGYSDASEQLVLEFVIESYDVVTMKLNGVAVCSIDGKKGTYTDGTFVGDNYAVYSLKLLGDRRFITGANNEPYCTVSEFVSGKDFVGFDKKYVVLTVDTENVSGEALLIFNSISNQTLTTFALRNDRDRQGPTIAIDGLLQTKVALNSVIILPKAESFDFFCGKATDLKVSVKKPDGTTVSFSAMTENSLLLNAFGTYVVTYSAKDSFGNTTTKNVNVNVLDLSAPVITVNDNIPQTLTVGKTLSLGNCVYSDDVGVTEKHIFVVNPDGLYEEVNGSYTFGKSGSYMIVYYARDGEGNRTLVRHNVYVG